MRPLIVGQITGVSQFAAVIAPAVLCRPHRWPSSNQATTLESQPIQGIQYVSGQTLRERIDKRPSTILVRVGRRCPASNGGRLLRSHSLILPLVLAVQYCVNNVSR